MPVVAAAVVGVVRCGVLAAAHLYRFSSSPSALPPGGGGSAASNSPSSKQRDELENSRRAPSRNYHNRLARIIRAPPLSHSRCKTRASWRTTTFRVDAARSFVTGFSPRQA